MRMSDVKTCRDVELRSPAPDRSLENIRRILCKYSSAKDFRSAGGNLFIAPLEKGDLSFLHKLFVGCSDEDIEKLSYCLGFLPPPEWSELLKLTDGAILFDNTLAFYGIKSDLNRSLDLEKQVPYSLLLALDEWKERGDPEWVPLGSLSAATLSFDLQCNQAGEVRLGASKVGYRRFPSIFVATENLCVLLESLTSDIGLIDDSGHELETNIFSLLRGS
jgi:hypothetical protein